MQGGGSDYDTFKLKGMQLSFMDIQKTNEFSEPVLLIFRQPKRRVSKTKEEVRRGEGMEGFKRAKEGKEKTNIKK